MQTTQEFIDRIYSDLTGGKVELEIDPVALKNLVRDGFEKVRAWYYETRIAQTIPLVAVSHMGDNGYFLKSQLAKPVRQIHKFYSTEPLSIYPGWTDAKIMGLERSLVDPTGYVNLAYYIEYAKSIDTLGLTEIDWVDAGDKYLIAGYMPANGKVTVSYYPQPQCVDDMTVQKAVDWLQDYVIAKVKRTVGRVRGKWTGGDINLETDASSLIQEANQELEELEDRLQHLDLRLI